MKLSNEDIMAIREYFRDKPVLKAFLFGSFSRGEALNDSDIDILVKFKETISLLELVHIHRELSALLGKRVDLITEQAVKNKRIKKYIYDDLQIIFE